MNNGYPALTTTNPNSPFRADPTTYADKFSNHIRRLASENTCPVGPPIGELAICNAIFATSSVRFTRSQAGRPLGSASGPADEMSSGLLSCPGFALSKVTVTVGPGTKLLTSNYAQRLGISAKPKEPRAGCQVLDGAASVLRADLLRTIKCSANQTTAAIMAAP